MALFGGERHGESLGAFERALARARENDLPRAEALILFNQARAFRALKRSETALQSARAALAIMVDGHFQAADAARSLVEALVAATLGDGTTEMRRLLDCARGSLTNPDLQPSTDLVEEVEARATELGSGMLASEAARLGQTIRSRHSERSGSVNGR